MRKIKEVLRLRFELGLGQREIARACSISQGAVHNYLKKAAGAGMQWPLPEGWDEKQIEEAVFGKPRSIICTHAGRAFLRERFLAMEGQGITWMGQPSRQGIAVFSPRLEFGEAQGEKRAETARYGRVDSG